MAMNFGVLLLLDGAGSLAAGLTFAAATAGMAALLYRSGGRWLAAGVGIGFALMTLVTGGECTLFTTTEYGAIGGLGYFVITVLMLIVAGVEWAVRPRDKTPGV
jgi:hypothetical protein